jgi:hypothetical protein
LASLIYPFGYRLIKPFAFSFLFLFMIKLKTALVNNFLNLNAEIR